jgi:hypothetical protein
VSLAIDLLHNVRVALVLTIRCGLRWPQTASRAADQTRFEEALIICVHVCKVGEQHVWPCTPGCASAQLPRCSNTANLPWVPDLLRAMVDNSRIIVAGNWGCTVVASARIPACCGMRFLLVPACLKLCTALRCSTTCRAMAPGGTALRNSQQTRPVTATVVAAPALTNPAAVTAA